MPTLISTTSGTLPENWSAIARVANDHKPPLSLYDTDEPYLNADLSVSEFVRLVEKVLRES